MNQLLEKLQNKLRGALKIVFMGIGEEKLSDDGVGPYIISELIDLSNEKILFINAATDPMDRIEEIVSFNPTHLVLLDTCTLSEPPGTIAVLERENLRDSVPISTHTIPIHLVIDLIIEKLPHLNVFMIGFVPESLEGFTELKLYKEDKFSLEERNENKDLPFFELNLTKTIQQAADQVIDMIKSIIQNL
ncbi:MAG: hydrogenase maturation protease [Candidatus Thorarchaeota archaeon]